MWYHRLIVGIAVIGTPASVFRRKAKEGWLGELAEVRSDALGSSDGEMGSDIDEADDRDLLDPEVATVEATDAPSEVNGHQPVLLTSDQAEDRATPTSQLPKPAPPQGEARRALAQRARARCNADSAGAGS